RFRAAALSSAIAGIEPSAAVLRERLGWSRGTAATVVGGAMWLAGLTAVLPFNAWAGVRPLAAVPAFADTGIFELLDYTSANLLLPVGALLTYVFVPWRLPARVVADEVGLRGGLHCGYRHLGAAFWPLAILALFVANL